MDIQPLQVLPTLVKVVGLREAIVLQELHYQLMNTDLKDGHLRKGKGVPNLVLTCVSRYPFWDQPVIERIIMRLEHAELLQVSGGPPPCHSIDYDHLHLMAATSLGAMYFSGENLYSVEGANTNRDFLFKIVVRKIAPNIYVMRAENASHFLACELRLEIKTHDQQTQAICHFPRINNKKIHAICERAHLIYNIITILFQASLLNQLLIFCEKQGASHLVIVPHYSSNLSFYQEFLRDLGVVQDKRYAEMIIPATHETRLKLTSFLQDTCFNLKIVLKAAQETNPRIAALVGKLLPEFLDSS